MDPRTAAGELAERLRSAHVHAGRPALGALETAVGYRSATLSQVLDGSLVPSWVLVRELGAVFGVSPDVVVQDWFALWTAANIHRGRQDADRERTPAADPVPASPDQASPDQASDTRTTATRTAGSRIPAVEATGAQVSAASAAQTGYTCARCGSWVVDTARHTDWHEAMEVTGRSPSLPQPLGSGWNVRSDEMSMLRVVLGTQERHRSAG